MTNCNLRFEDGVLCVDGHPAFELSCFPIALMSFIDCFSCVSHYCSGIGGPSSTVNYSSVWEMEYGIVLYCVVLSIVGR
jgi:hypothetical protein